MHNRTNAFDCTSTSTGTCTVSHDSYSRFIGRGIRQTNSARSWRRHNRYTPTTELTVYSTVLKSSSTVPGSRGSVPDRASCTVQTGNFRQVFFLPALSNRSSSTYGPFSPSYVPNLHDNRQLLKHDSLMRTDSTLSLSTIKYETVQSPNLSGTETMNSLNLEC